MYAPLQQAWIGEIKLSACQVERYFKALMVFLACFSLFGWTYALIALGLFCAYQRGLTQPKQYLIRFSPEGVSAIAWDMQQSEPHYLGQCQSVVVGWGYLSFRWRYKEITIWQCQVSDCNWRCLRTLAKQVWQQQ